MDWVLNHLQVLFVIAIAVVAMLQRLKKGAEGADSGPATAPSDPDEAARTRRIQEEIRRRIMERRGLVPPAREVAPPVTPFSPAPPMIEEVRPFRVESPVAAADEIPAVQGMAAEFKRQQELNDRVRELEAARRAREAVAAESVKTALAEPTNHALPDLRSHAGLRRAIVLREILGPPIGLR